MQHGVYPFINKPEKKSKYCGKASGYKQFLQKPTF